jgi:hypothetical protein
MIIEICGLLGLVRRFKHPVGCCSSLSLGNPRFNIDPIVADVFACPEKDWATAKNAPFREIALRNLQQVGKLLRLKKTVGHARKSCALPSIGVRRSDQASKEFRNVGTS